MREEKIQKLEVHVAGICFHENKVLVIKRAASRKLFPNLWECGGGQVEMGENFEEAITRQLKEELGIIVKPLMIFKTYEILTPYEQQKKIPGIRFVCKILGYVNGKGPKISKEHSEWCWQPVDKIDEFELVPGLKDDVKTAHVLFKQLNKS